jgi:hypothetical protein
VLLEIGHCGIKGELGCGCQFFGHWKPRLAPAFTSVLANNGIGAAGQHVRRAAVAQPVKPCPKS